MPWIREGSCNQCGKCCIAEMGYRPMLNEKGICKYLDGASCKIRDAVLAGDITSIPKDHLRYWREECEPYPDPKSDAHTPPVHHLLKECGFRMVWRDD